MHFIQQFAEVSLYTVSRMRDKLFHPALHFKVTSSWSTTKILSSKCIFKLHHFPSTSGVDLHKSQFDLTNVQVVTLQYVSDFWNKCQDKLYLILTCSIQTLFSPYFILCKSECLHTYIILHINWSYAVCTCMYNDKQLYSVTISVNYI